MARTLALERCDRRVVTHWRLRFRNLLARSTRKPRTAPGERSCSAPRGHAQGNWLSAGGTLRVRLVQAGSGNPPMWGIRLSNCMRVGCWRTLSMPAIGRTLAFVVANTVAGLVAL